jgi:hypothetical protein
MREILFRAKTIANNSVWVEGFYNHIPCGRFLCDEHCIQTIDEDGRIGQLFDVYESTVGQYIGLTDKNGKKIFEGDMFGMDDGEIFAVVIFKDGCFRLEMHGICDAWTESGYDEYGGEYGIIEVVPIDWYYICDMEVIGNIHDNPELLEVE